MRFTLAGNGTGEIASVLEALGRTFAKRRVAIPPGPVTPAAAAARAATLATRQAKEHLPTRELLRRWHDEAQWSGIDPAAVVRRAVGRHVEREPAQEPLRDPGRVPGPVPAVAPAQGPPGPRPGGRRRSASGPEADALDVHAVLGTLTAQDATFDRRAVVRAVAADRQQGMTLDRIDPAVLEVLRSPEAVLVDDDRWTTQELLAVETAAVTSAARLRGSGVGIVGHGPVDAVLAARPTFSEDQAAMVRHF